MKLLWCYSDTVRVLKHVIIVAGAAWPTDSGQYSIVA